MGRNGSGKTTLLRLVSGIFKPTSGRIAVGGRIASLLELGAGFHPDFTGRENVYLNGSIHGLSPRARDPRADGRDRRLRRARALHRPARPHVFVRDVHAARLLGRRPHPGRRAAPRRGVRRRRRGVPAQVLRRRSTSSRAAAGRSSSSRTTRRRSSGSATGPCCSGTARSSSTATTRDAIVAVPPAARGRAQPRRARGRPARVGERRGADRLGTARSTATATPAASQFASGEPLTSSSPSRPTPGVAAAARLARAARQRRGRARRRHRSRPPSSAGATGPGERDPPLRDRHGSRSPRGSSTSAARSSTRDGGGCCTRSTTRLRFFVFPAGAETGAVLLEGRWTVQEIGDVRANRTAHELAHLPRLASADGDRARAPVQALHAARGRSCRRTRS